MPQPDDLALFWARAKGAKLTDLARTRGHRHSTIQNAINRAGVALLLPHLGEIAQWRTALDNGAAPETVAQVAGVPAELVQVAVHGWPAAYSLNPETVAHAAVAWANGATRAETAQLMGISPNLLVLLRRTGAIVLPHRETSTSFAAQLGWSKASFTRHRGRGRLPQPDGQDHGSWWWPRTIKEWIETADLAWCEPCHRAFVEPRGLSAHRTKIHGKPNIDATRRPPGLARSTGSPSRRS